MKKLLLKYLIACLLLSCTLMCSGCYFLPEQGYKKLEAPVVQDPTRLQYTTVIAEKDTISEVKQAEGQFVYSYYNSFKFDEYKSYNAITGDHTLKAEDGSSVKKGAVLFTVNSNELDEQIKHNEVLVEQLVVQKNEMIAAAQTDKLELQQLLIEEAQATLKSLTEKKKLYTVTAAFDGKIKYIYDTPANEALKKPVEMVLYVEDKLTFMSDAETVDKQLLLSEKGKIYPLVDGAADRKSSVGGQVTKVPVQLADGYSETDKYYYITLQYAEGDKTFQYGEQGMFEVIVATHKDTVVVPKRAIKTYKSSENFVRKLAADGLTRTEVVVKVGISSVDYVEILDGVEEGDVIIVD